ncbi:MAG TPA: peptidylprolyl isomerase [Jatrophihabitantaceae bacterium]
MPTNKQRREAARRHLERQLERRQQQEAVRKRRTLIATVAGTVVLAALVVTFVVVVTGEDKKKPAAQNSTSATSPSPSPSSTQTPLPSRTPKKIAARAPKKTSGPCKYAESAATLTKNPNLFDVGLPPDPSPTPKAKHTVVFATNKGDITAEFDGTAAPCMVQSLDYLISKKFYDNTACPRSVNHGIFVVQCGDPTESGSGGPTYTVKDENLSKADYSEGAIAMANGGPNTNGSQFFFITKDSNENAAAGTGLQKKYTVVGHVTRGIDVLRLITEAGDDGSNQAGGGRPRLDLIFKTVRLTSAKG